MIDLGETAFREIDDVIKIRYPLYEIQLLAAVLAKNAFTSTRINGVLGVKRIPTQLFAKTENCAAANMMFSGHFTRSNWLGDQAGSVSGGFVAQSDSFHD